jgi:CRISPR-associated RAMP protein, Cmr1 family
MSFYISRFKGIEKQEFEVEIVTPLFLGGADSQKAELRVPPIKGALRFWWRALYGSDDLEDLKKREADIFGSTEHKSKVTIRIESNDIMPVLRDLPSGKKIMVTSKGKTFPISIIEYLAFGLFDPKQKQNKYLRKYFEPGVNFKIGITCAKNNFSEIKKTLSTMISFGGLGSRSRNGFGAIHCTELSINAPGENKDTLKSFSAFSNKSILFDKFNAYDRWEDALFEIGLAYRTARLELENRHTFTKRGFIGLPIESKFEKIPKEIREGRHAKPYFLHVSKLSDGKYQGQILFMPYLYYDQNKRDQYYVACEKMNQKIHELSGGSR